MAFRNRLEISCAAPQRVPTCTLTAANALPGSVLFKNHVPSAAPTASIAHLTHAGAACCAGATSDAGSYSERGGALVVLVEEEVVEAEGEAAEPSTLRIASATCWVRTEQCKVLGKLRQWWGGEQYRM